MIMKLIFHQIVAQQQRLIVLTTFNVITIYYNYRMYIGKTTNLEQLTQGNIDRY